MPTASPPGIGDVVAALVAVIVGYAAGSLPATAGIGRLAGVVAPGAAAGDSNPGTSTAAMPAGPGWGLLAVVAGLATGVIPVAVAAVTFSWTAGWAVGIGVVAGAAWPALGRVRGVRDVGGVGGVGVLVGVLVALEPAAAFVSILIGMVAAGLARLTGRTWRSAALAGGLGTCPLLVFAAELDVGRVLAVIALGLLAMVNRATASRQA